jgi:septum formation protein
VLSLPFRVVLGSKSPRRVEILRQLVPGFEQDPADLDEDALKTMDPWQTAEWLAEHKAKVVFERHPDALVIGGDTVVGLPRYQHSDTQRVAQREGENEYELLGKPESEGEAKEMLRKLSGKNHVVVSGVCLLWPGGQTAFSDTTVVRFRELNEAEIGEYVATGDPMDKAGGYAIQGVAGKFIEGIEGSYSNVVGMPQEKLEEALRQIASA